MVHARAACASGATRSSSGSAPPTRAASTAASPGLAATIGVSGALLLASLLLVAGVGAEFMPQLDEGALWVRATMPYTISFDESSKIVPQVRAILALLPRGHVVASEHGRPDDGTDPTGFFNAEFYVGLKPYSEWHGAIRTKPQLIAAINDKLQSFPGITFNYTQPAEDAVDEAETGLKSALAVKVFGPDLDMLEQKGRAIKAVLEHVRGITRRHAGAGARPAEPHDRRSIATRSRATGSTSTTSTA